MGRAGSGSRIPPIVRARLASYLLRAGDPISAREGLQDGKSSEARFAREACVAAIMEEAVSALGGDATLDRVRNLASAALALVPELDLAAKLAELKDETDVARLDDRLASVPATGRTRTLLLRSRLSRLVAEGALDRAISVAALAGEGELAFLRTEAARCVGRALARAGARETFLALERHRERLGEGVIGRLRGDPRFAALWAQPGFEVAFGPPDPFARPVPYVADVVTSDGVSLGPCRVVSVDAESVSLERTSRPGPLRLPATRLFAGSLCGEEPPR
jgi:hypothetical protein